MHTPETKSTIFQKSSKFIQFDIESFYPSITKELLGRALDYAQSIVNIDQTNLDIIQHSWKSLLFTGSECWIKGNKSPTQVKYFI